MLVIILYHEEAKAWEKLGDGQQLVGAKQGIKSGTVNN